MPKPRSSPVTGIGLQQFAPEMRKLDTMLSCAMSTSTVARNYVTIIKNKMLKY